MKLTNKSFLWVEKYRPSTVSECILPERLKKMFQEYVNSGEIPNLMLTGPAGTGKTTVAIALCEEVGVNYLFINGSKERGIDTIKVKIENYASTVSLTGGKKVIILDEADNLTTDAQMALRGSIEAFATNCTFIFTCNFKSRLMDALHSRSPAIDFTLKRDEKPEMANQLFKRIIQILDLEKVLYEKQAVVKLIEKFFPDYRRTLGELQRYSKLGAIDASVVALLSDVRKMSELTKALKDKNFGEMRKWVVVNSDIDTAYIYRKIYDSLVESFKPESIPQAVIIIARYQYQSAFVPDQEINLVACLTEIMVDCEFV